MYSSFYNRSSIFFIFLLGIVISIPILFTPLGTDDIWMSTLRSHNEFNDMSWLDYLIFKSEEFHNIGRLSQITNLIQWITSYFISNRLVYKIFLIIINFMVALLIRKMILELVTKQFSYYANLAFILFISLGEIRNYYDPRTSITGIAQFTSIAMMLAIRYVIKYYSNPSNQNIMLFTLFSIISFYMYELTFFILFPVFIFVFFEILIKNRSSEKRKKWIPNMLFLLLIFQYLIFLWTHYSAPSLQDDSTINFSWEKIKNTFLFQFFGSFPATNFGTQKVYEPNFVSNKVKLLVISLIVILLILFIQIFRKSLVNKTQITMNAVSDHLAFLTFWVFALSMMIIPTTLTALTLRFQEDVQAGLPYAGFYFLQIGFSLLVPSLFFVIRKKLFEILLTAALGLSIIYFAFISTIVNYTVINLSFPLNDNASLSQPVLGWDRETVEDFARSGFFSSQDVSYYLFPQYSWTTTEYLSFNSGQKVSVLNSPPWWNNTSVLPNLECQKDEVCFDSLYVEANGFSYSSGALITSRLKDLSVDGGEIFSSHWKVIFVGNFENSLNLQQCESILSPKGFSISDSVQAIGKKNFIAYRIDSIIPIHSNELRLCFK